MTYSLSDVIRALVAAGVTADKFPCVIDALEYPVRPSKDEKKTSVVSIGRPALAEAIARVGGQARLATAINVSPQAISQWTVCPSARVIELERISGVSRHVLRPDLYPPAPDLLSEGARA